MLNFARKQHSAALAFLAAGTIWFLIGTTYGLFSAIHLVSPEFFNNIPFLVFGRTRPTHVNTVIYGFIVNTFLGAILYYVPALLRTRLWSQGLAWAAFIFWQIAVLSGPATFSFGITQGREYTEYIFPFDVCVMLTLLLLLVDMIMTTVNRQENYLYVSVWYAFGTLIWTAGVYPIGNVMWMPGTGALPGILDSIFLWFYGHNLVGLLLTPMAVGTAYYVVPRITRTPLYSHTLSLIGFWLLVAIYTHIGSHHLLQAPIPNWLKVLAVADSIAMILPVTVALSNIWLTARGKMGLLWHDPAGRFVLMGTIWYLITCIQGPIQSLPTVQKVTHFNNWTIGHAHIAVLGFSGFIALGGLWHVLPLITGRQLYSRRLVSLQFGLVLFGITGFFLVLTAAGLIQGNAWYLGEPVYKVLPMISEYMILRLLSGLFIIASAVIGLYNFFMTLSRGAPLELTGEDVAPPPSAESSSSPFRQGAHP